MVSYFVGAPPVVCWFGLVICCSVRCRLRRSFALAGTTEPHAAHADAVGRRHRTMCFCCCVVVFCNVVCYLRRFFFWRTTEACVLKPCVALPSCHFDVRPLVRRACHFFLPHVISSRFLEEPQSKRPRISPRNSPSPQPKEKAARMRDATQIKKKARIWAQNVSARELKFMANEITEELYRRGTRSPPLL